MSDYARLLERADQILARATYDRNFVITKAKGTTIWLNGKPHLDFVSGPGVANIGHNHPEVIETVKKVLDNDEAGYGGNMLINEYQVALAEKLCQITPGKFPKKVFFSNSGGEAVEAAIIACMKRRPERRGMVSFIGDFHGRLGFGRTATTSRQMHFERMPWGIEKTFFLAFPAENPETPLKKQFLETVDTPEKYLNYVENTIGPFINEINFALIELVQGEGGINVAHKEMLRTLIKYLQDNGVWVIADEVQSGLGRTGEMWASDLYKIEPDILTIAKALSGGVVPIGATVMREELAFQKAGEHSNTFGGNPQACAAGLKVLEIIQKNDLVRESEDSGNLLRLLLRGADLDVSGCGLMSRLTLRDTESRNKVVKEALDRGLFLTGAGERSLRLMPPLTSMTYELIRAVGILKETIKDAR